MSSAYIALWSNNPEAASLRVQKSAGILPVIKRADDDGGDSTPGDSEDGPPNLRHANYNEGNCGGCEYFTGPTSNCRKYNVPVQQDMTCDSFEPKSGAMAAPELDKLKSPMGLPTPSPTLTPEQDFKFAFLYECADKGLTIDETCELAEKTAAYLEGNVKEAFLGIGPGIGTTLAGAGSALGGAGLMVGGAGGLLTGLGAVAIPAGLAIAATGHGIGNTLADTHHAANKKMVDDFNKDNVVSVDDFKNLELINEYKSQAAKSQKALQDWRASQVKPVKQRFDRF